MEKIVSGEQGFSGIVDNCHRAVHHSLEDIQKAIALLEKSGRAGDDRECLADDIATVNTILEEICQEFQELDRQIQSLSCTLPVAKTSQEPTEKASLKHLLSSWFHKNDLDKTA